MIKLTNVRSRDWTGPVSILFQAEQNLFGLGTFLVPVPVRDAAVQAKQATHYLQLSSPEAIGADQRSVMPSIHHLHRQDKTVLSCPRWQYEQNWQQIKTVGNRIFRNWMFFFAVLSSLKIRYEETCLQTCSHYRWNWTKLISLQYCGLL